MSRTSIKRAGRALWAGGRVVLLIALTALLTGFMFLLLPLLEQVSRMGKEEVEIRSVGTADLPPPPPPPEEPPLKPELLPGGVEAAATEEERWLPREEANRSGREGSKAPPAYQRGT